MVIRCGDPDCNEVLEEIDRYSTYGEVGYGWEYEAHKVIRFRNCLNEDCMNSWHEFEWNESEQ